MRTCDLMRVCRLLWLLAALATGCAPLAPEPPPKAPPVPVAEPVGPAPAPAGPEPPPAAGPAPTAPPAPAAPIARHLIAEQWDALPDWHKDNLREAWSAFLASCMALKARSEWQPVCWAAAEVASHDEATLREFFEGRFRPWSVRGGDGAAEGLVTGYYEPLLRGSRGRSDRYRFALYSAPDDLVAVELGALVPELNAQRVRGRLDGRRIVPYYTRAEIDGAQAPLRGRELFWVDDQVELFFLHIQGSGRIRLDSGETVKIGYADHNGHPYRSVGKILIDRGELAPEKASMQAIQAWARRNPEKLSKVLAENPAYVFFRELPDGASGPIGSLGVALTPERSIAVDPQYVPLGAPVYLSTARPNTGESMNRLVLAQDTGSAIKGAVRADFFWGFGPEAGQLAGRTRHPGRMWVLLPRDFPPPAQRNQAGGKTTAPESDAKESEGLR